MAQHPSLDCARDYTIHPSGTPVCIGEGVVAALALTFDVAVAIAGDDATSETMVVRLAAGYSMQKSRVGQEPSSLDNQAMNPGQRC